MTTTSRRAILAGIAAAPVLAAPAIAAVGECSPPDPIFAAIERHRTICAAFEAAISEDCQIPDGEPGFQWVEPYLTIRERRDYYAEENDEAAVPLVKVVPTTIAGATALLAYFLEQISKDDGRVESSWQFPERIDGDEPVMSSEEGEQFAYALMRSVADALRRLQTGAVS